jgi:hypothetical protein
LRLGKTPQFLEKEKPLQEYGKKMFSLFERTFKIIWKQLFQILLGS